MAADLGERARPSETFVWMIGPEDPQNRAVLSQGLEPTGTDGYGVLIRSVAPQRSPVIGSSGTGGLPTKTNDLVIPDQASDTLHVLAAWREWLEAQYAAPTIRMYWGALFRFFSHFPLPVAEIAEDHVVRFLAAYPFRSSARRTYYQALRNFFGWCERRHIIMVDPTSAIRVPAVVEKVPAALSENELERLVAAAEQRDPRRALTILLLYHTAARLNELVHLRWADIGEEELVLRTTKTGKERAIPMTPKLAAVCEGLRVYFGDRPRVVPRSPQTIWSWVRDAGRDAGIPRVHPHLLRSTAATRMLVRGARPHAVRELLGHVNLRTTQRYWAVEKDDKEQAAGLL